MFSQKQLEKQEAWRQYVRRELEDAQREAADPNTQWVSADDMLREGEALLYEMECQRAAKSA
jgi:hypothetical protein